MKIDSDTYKFTDAGRTGAVSLVSALVGIVLCIVGYAVNSEQFFYSYLTAYTYWVTIVLGALFFVMLQNLVNPVWSIVIQRLIEAVMRTIPAMAILFIPVILGIHELYHWSHAEAVASDTVLQGKAGYLNITFFIVRAVVYFAAWTALAISLHRLSVKQDAGFDEARQARIRRLSAGGIVIFAITVTLAAFDWIMSLDAHWYSTIFGVYVFSGGLVSTMAFSCVMFMLMRAKGVLREQVTVEHYHDFGKLGFAFMIFWAYIAFSQYLLIWYANIPEETVWYQHRWVGSWKAWSLLLVLGHFIVPFFIMITRGAKRKLRILATLMVWLMLMHFVDDYFLVMPNLHHHGISLSWMDAGSMLAIGGVFVWMFWRTYTSNAAVPVADPKLEASIQFENA